MSIFSRQYKGKKTFLNVKVICASFLIIFPFLFSCATKSKSTEISYSTNAKQVELDKERKILEKQLQELLDYASSLGLDSTHLTQIYSIDL